MSAKKTLLLFAFAFCISTAAQSQSVFYMNYRFTSIEDTTLYHVFLVRHEDGKGFYRVRFFDPESKDDIVVEMDMEERYFKDKNGNTDTTKLYLKGSNPVIVYGDKNYKHYPERFWFKLDKRSDLFEPWAVTSPDESGTAQGKFVDPPELLDPSELTEDLVALFFLEEDEFYQNLFKVKARGLSPQEKQAKLHLIIVANTEDETIGNTCVLDKDRTYKTFKDLSEFLGIGFNSNVIFGNTYSKQNVQAAVQALAPAPKDIVVFYYSGHGFADQNSNKVFPNMALSNKSFEDAVANSMNIEDVYMTIKRKGARLNLVFSDCCNNAPDDRASLSCDIPQTRSSGLGWSLENCKNLFMNDKPMSILMTAAQKGEQSTGNASYGGFFTNQFRSNLITHFGPFHQYPTWDVILGQSKKNTTEQAENSRCSESNTPLRTYKQHPVYRIQ
ncbi:MAG: caspase family protein [Ferruginibacter sp.]